MAKVGGEVLNLPVDEDDYLMPSPSGSQQPPLSATAQNGYMDLIGDGKISGNFLGLHLTLVAKIL